MVWVDWIDVAGFPSPQPLAVDTTGARHAGLVVKARQCVTCPGGGAGSIRQNNPLGGGTEGSRALGAVRKWLDRAATTV